MAESMTESKTKPPATGSRVLTTSGPRALLSSFLPAPATWGRHPPPETTHPLKGKPETGLLPAGMGRDASATRPP